MLNHLSKIFLHIYKCPDSYLIVLSPNLCGLANNEKGIKFRRKKLLCAVEFIDNFILTLNNHKKMVLCFVLLFFYLAEGCDI